MAVKRNSMNRNVILQGELEDHVTKEVIGTLLELDSYSSATINLYINSEGGDSYNGFAIYDVIGSLKSVVKTYGIGSVASAATIVFLAGDARTLMPHTEFMIHGCSYSDMGGKVEDLEFYKKLAVDTNEKMIAVYRQFNNKPLKWWRDRIRREKDWYLTPQEIIELGFIS